MRIGIVVFDGFDDLDALGPLEVLRSAERAGGDFQSWLVTRTPQPQVTTSHGLRVIPDVVYPAGAELLIVPAATGRLVPMSAPGVRSTEEAGCRYSGRLPVAGR